MVSGFCLRWIPRSKNHSEFQGESNLVGSALWLWPNRRSFWVCFPSSQNIDPRSKNDFSTFNVRHLNAHHEWMPGWKRSGGEEVAESLSRGPGPSSRWSVTSPVPISPCNKHSCKHLARAWKCSGTMCSLCSVVYSHSFLPHSKFCGTAF